MKATVIKIEDGVFNDIITVKLENGTVLESRGFNLPNEVISKLKKGTPVLVTTKYNDLAKKEFVNSIELN